MKALLEIVMAIDETEFKNLVYELEKRFESPPRTHKTVTVRQWLLAMKLENPHWLKRAASFDEKLLATRCGELQQGFILEVLSELCTLREMESSDLASKTVLEALRAYFPKPDRTPRKVSRYEKKKNLEISIIKNRRKWNTDTGFSKY
jgi:hypothetical protein